MVGLQEGAEKSCLYLVKAGSDVNLTDHEGQSVLFYAVHSSYLHTLEVAKKLIKAGKFLLSPFFICSGQWLFYVYLDLTALLDEKCFCKQLNIKMDL